MMALESYSILKNVKEKLALCSLFIVRKLLNRILDFGDLKSG